MHALKYVAALAAVGASVILVPPAFATSVTLGSGNPVVATATATNLTDTTSGVGVSCTGSTISATVNSDGSGTIANGDATFSGCSSILGNFAVTQLDDWSLQINYNSGAPTLSVTVPGVLPAPANRWVKPSDAALEFELIGGGCKFWVSGTVTSDAASSTAVSAIDFTSKAGLQVIAVDAGNNCAGLVYPGDSMTPPDQTSYDSNYGLNQTVTVAP